NRLVYWPTQVLYSGVVLTPVWVAGALWSLRSAAARPFRPAAIACLTVIALQFILGGKPYYPGGAFTFLLAAGCVPLERRLAARARDPGRGGHGGGRGTERAGGASGSARQGPARRAAAEDQLRPRRGDRLAQAGGAGRAGVPRRAGRAADHDLGRQLRRGGSD